MKGYEGGSELPHVRIKRFLDVLRRKESEKAESNPGHLVCAASTLPLSYDNRTITSPHNPLYVLHRWY